MANLNPVEQRLVVLGEHWLEFRSHPTARALVWQVPADALRLVECFVAMQKHPVPYATGDVFIPFNAPYHHGLQFARDIKVALRGTVDASKDDLVAQGLNPDWPFVPEATPDTPAEVMRALRSFATTYLDRPARLAAVLRPKSVAHAGAFANWVSRLMDADAADGPRLLLMDPLEEPLLTRLIQREDEARLLIQQPPVETFTMAQETFAQEAAVGPAGVYRNLMMGVVTLLERGSLESVLAKAADALAFARKQGWADQEVALRTMVAGAYLKFGRHADAVKTYQAARISALQAVGSDHPAGLKLVQQAWIGEAGAQLAASDFDKAAGCYGEAAEVAARDGNNLLHVESHRMAGWCLWRSGQSQASLDRIARATEAGAAMEPELRSQSTLPIALVDALRVVDETRVMAMQQAKGQLRDELESIRADSEEQGQAIECRPHALELIEQKRDALSEKAIADTRERLERLVAQGPQAFVGIANRGRKMLGDEWLVANDIALRPMAPEARQARGASP